MKTLFLCFIFLFLPFLAFGYSYTDDIDDYDLGVLDGQNWWQEAVGESFVVQNWAGHKTIGFSAESGLHDTFKNYWDNSLDGSVEVWLWFGNYYGHIIGNTDIKVENENGTTCGHMAFRIASTDYVTAGGLYSPIELNKAIKIKISWTDDYGGLKFKYELPNGSSSEDWVDPHDSSCKFAENGVSTFRLISNSQGEGYFWLFSLNYENGIYFPTYTEQTPNTTVVSSLFNSWAEYDIASTTWDIGLDIRGYNYFLADPDWSDLIVEIYDRSDTLLASTTRSVLYEDIGSNVIDTYGKFTFQLKFEDLTSEGLITRYRVKTYFYNTTSDIYSNSDDWYFTVRTDEDYRTEDEYLLIYQQQISEELTEWHDKWGIFGILSDRITDLLSSDKFPFSWIYGMYSVYQTVKELTYTTTTPPVYSFDLASSTAFFGSSTFVFFDLSSVQTNYSSFFTAIRTLFTYMIYLSTIFLIYKMVKGFIYNLKEED